MVLLQNDPPKMDADRKEITKTILNFTLEIIYLLTGEDYTVVKKTSGRDSVAPGSHESGEWSRSQSPITDLPIHSLIPESKNEKKILELIHKITELLTGEVPIRSQDVTVYFSMEEWEYIEGHKDLYKAIMMEDHKPLMLKDESSTKKEPEKCPVPVHPQERPEEKPIVPNKRQAENLIDIKAEVLDDDDDDDEEEEEEEEEMDFKSDHWDGLIDRNPRQRRRTRLYSQEYPEKKHRVLKDDQDEYLINIKVEADEDEEEEEERTRSDDLCMREMEDDSLVDVITGVYTGNSTILKTLTHKGAFNIPGSGDYRRMGIDVGALISEVQARPYLWDSSVSGYSDRRLREQSWLEITQALYPDWGRYSQSKQWNILKDIKTRWKSVRDRFLKEERNAERSGSTNPRRRKCPFHDELMFLLPIRRPRKSRGNYRENQSRAESADEDDGQQPTPSTSTPAPQETEGDIEELVGPLWVSQPSSPIEEMAATTATKPRPAAATSPVVQTQHARTAPVTRAASMLRQSRRTLRNMDRHLEVESQALSPIRRVDSEDEYDIFGYRIASRCRQMRPDVRDTFIAYVGVAATVFESAYPLPKLGDLINHLRSITGLSDIPPPHIPRARVQSSSSKTNPIYF
ncbi:uncharacterized protein LOC130274504 [Hyla sarda]|uniref:uncharacterized protein LOC130274504 n=1 Tax=Hyla sarda TaxID=327740 RepID=UPI0024C30CEC|nr:uncharacterized protein LOC130274504 [Hyla sarda]XP_056378903.1 uncharacterized protein LOC130274504 [Hyla sarda]